MKTAKLTAFRNSAAFDSLPDAERHRLNGQLSIMQTYSGVLGERIAAFTA